MNNFSKIHDYLQSNNVKNLIILCRGKSVEKFIKFNNKEINDSCIIFVNKFSELSKNEKLMDRIKNNGEKPNIQYINNDHKNLEKTSKLKMFNIELIQSNKKKTDEDAPRHLMHLQKIQAYPEIFFIDNSTEDSNYKLKSNGMSCVGYLSKLDFVKNIYIFGLDFFECDYFSHHVHTGNKSVREYQPKKGKVAKKQLKAIVQKNKHINYHLYTYAKFEDCKFDNFCIY